MGAIVEVVVGFGAVFQDTPQLTVGEYIDSKMQSHTYAVTEQIENNIILFINFEKYFSTNYIRIKIIYIFAARIQVQKEKQKTCTRNDYLV
jgi:hypothetical protein